MECVVDSCNVKEALIMEDMDDDLNQQQTTEKNQVGGDGGEVGAYYNDAIDVEVEHLVEELEDDDETIIQLLPQDGEDDDDEPATTITTKKKSVAFSDEEIQALRAQVVATTPRNDEEENIPPPTFPPTSINPESAAAVAAATAVAAAAAAPPAGGGGGTATTTTTVSAVPLASVLLGRARSKKKQQAAVESNPDTASTADWRPPMTKPPPCTSIDGVLEMAPPSTVPTTKQKMKPIKKLQQKFNPLAKRKQKLDPSPPPVVIEEEEEEEYKYDENNTIAESIVILKGNDELVDGDSSSSSKRKVKTFTLTVYPNQRLGLKVHSYGYIKEVFATSIYKNEINSKTDQVIEVNGINLSDKVSDDILKIIQSLPQNQPRIYTIKRENPSYMSIEESKMIDQDDDVAHTFKYDILSELRTKYLCDFGDIPWELRY